MTFDSGLETITNMGHTGAAQLYDSNLTRIDAMLWAQRTAMVIGDLQAGVETDAVFAAFTFPTDVVIKSVEFNAHAGNPIGSDAILKIKIGGIAQGTATLPASTDHAVATISSAGTTVTPTATAGQLVELAFTQVGSGSPGAWVSVTLNLQKKCNTP